MILQNTLFTSTDVTASNRSLHTPGAFAKNNLMYVQEVGQLKSLKPHRCIREGIDSYLLMAVTKGSGLVEIEGKTTNISEGDVVFVDCNKHFEHESSSDNAWELAWVHFNGVNASQYFEIFKSACPSQVIRIQNLEQIESDIHAILRLCENKNLKTELLMNEKIVSLLTNILICADVEGNYDKEKINELREYININFADKNVCSDIDSDLEKSFEKLYGIRVSEYVLNRRINSVKELLRFTVKSVEEIATESGFDNISELSDAFIKAENVSLDEYRSKWAHWVRN